jgi:hypothetical protein
MKQKNKSHRIQLASEVEKEKWKERISPWLPWRTCNMPPRILGTMQMVGVCLCSEVDIVNPLGGGAVRVKISPTAPAVASGTPMCCCTVTSSVVQTEYLKDKINKLESNSKIRIGAYVNFKRVTKLELTW